MLSNNKMPSKSAKARTDQIKICVWNRKMQKKIYNQ